MPVLLQPTLDDVLFAAPSQPHFGQYGPFAGRFFQVSSPTNTQAGTALRAMHAGWQGQQVLHDGWEPSHTKKPFGVSKRANAPRLRVFEDRSMLLGRADPTGTRWHPFVLTSKDKSLAIPRARVSQGTDERHACWEPDGNDGMRTTTGAPDLLKVWPASVWEAVEEWDAHLGNPKPVHSAENATGTFCAAAPFVTAHPEALARTRDLLHLAITMLAPDGVGGIDILPVLPSHKGGATQGRLQITMKTPNTALDWLGKAIHHPHWPLPPRTWLQPIATQGFPHADGIPIQGLSSLVSVTCFTPASSHQKMAAHQALSIFTHP